MNIVESLAESSNSTEAVAAATDRINSAHASVGPPASAGKDGLSLKFVQVNSKFRAWTIMSRLGAKSNSRRAGYRPVPDDLSQQPSVFDAFPNKRYEMMQAADCIKRRLLPNFRSVVLPAPQKIDKPPSEAVQMMVAGAGVVAEVKPVLPIKKKPWIRPAAVKSPQNSPNA